MSTLFNIYIDGILQGSGGGGGGSASDVTYDNTNENLIATNIQDAVDEIQGDNPGIGFNTTNANPAYEEGLTFYDSTKKALSYYTNQSDVTLNLGKEIVFDVENQTGSLIENGTIITPSMDTIITLANANHKDLSRIIAVATHDIPDGEVGLATKLGQVGGLDTSEYTEGQVIYLSNTEAGKFTATTPINGGFIVTVGVVDVVDEFEGIITVDTRTSDLTVEVTDTNGFPPDQRDNTTLSFMDGTRTFTISPDLTDFHFYENGDKYEKTSSESIVIPDSEGLHVIYYSDGVLTTIFNPSDGQVDVLIRTKPLVAFIYWDAENSQHNFILDERHGISMSPSSHSYNHFTRGCQYLSGGAIGDVIADGDGDLDTSAQFSITSAFYVDEDILTISASIAKTVGFPIYYLDGANANLRRITNTGFSMLNDIAAGTGSTGRLVYNEWTGTEWVLSTVPNRDFALIHIFGINGNTGSDQMISVIGQEEYGNRGRARAGAETEISNLLLSLPAPEIIPIATIILETRDTYTNGVQSIIVSTDEGDDFIDWRTSELIAGATPSSHNNLANLELANTGVTWGHINDQPQSIYGEKTLEEGLICNSYKISDNTIDVTTSRSLALTDNAKFLQSTSATDINLTVEDEATVNFPVGSEIQISMYGAGTVTIVADAGVTINTPDDLVVDTQYESITLKKLGSDEWLVKKSSSGGGGDERTWDLSRLNKTLDVSSQMSNPYGACFNSTGDRLYVASTTSDTIYQYNLSAFDLDTAAYSTKSFSISSEVATCFELRLGDSDAKIYALNFSNDIIYQYTMSTPGDISTASFDSKSFSVGSQEGSPTGFDFSSDGLKMYAVGFGDIIYQYTLSTAWDISTASYASKSLSVSAEESTTYSVVIGDSDDKAYITGDGERNVVQYNLSTTGDINTGQFATRISMEFANTPGSLLFSSDGQYFYITDPSGKKIYQYMV